MHFNPRAPCGARLFAQMTFTRAFTFQPTRPLRGATVATGLGFFFLTDFNPRAPCGARPSARPLKLRSWNFNPRAPCGARLAKPSLCCRFAGRISTHAPLAGRDEADKLVSKYTQKFQPTRPLRGATRSTASPVCRVRFQPTRPLRGATLVFFHSVQTSKFQPTRPLRGATRGPCGQGRHSRYFNPRAPCGARPRSSDPGASWENFNPRAPCGARQQKCTNHYAHFCDNRQISDAFAQNAACQGILLLFDAGKPCGFWVRTAQVISAHLCFAL